MNDGLDGLMRDSDVRTASILMGLGPDAFTPVGEDMSRREALLSLESADFEACPGSGKTTLLVAKLALLAMRWPHRQRGLCVLSHTNAARNEIGTRLSHSPAGGALLRYPHFMGTIHSFVNEFLALPWLRSKGCPVRVIDTQVALRQRMSTLAQNWRKALERRGLGPDALIYSASDYTGGTKGKLDAKTDFYRALVANAKASSEKGFFCFEEMFVWANELLDRHPEVVTILRTRFPMVFVDEAQDNDEAQSAILYRIFRAGASPSRRQRFGDSNQAIYHHAEAKGAQTDRFPQEPIFQLPRSYRFDQKRAKDVQGLGVSAVDLIGAGPTDARIAGAPRPPVLFLFDDDSVGRVLPRYGAHLVAHFDASELALGTFTAVAAVHTLKPNGRVPQAMGHYAPGYNPSSASKEAAPATFLQFLHKAKTATALSGSTQALVNALGSALWATCDLLSAPAMPSMRKSAHRRVVERLGTGPAAEAYQRLIDDLIVSQGEILEVPWRATWLPAITHVLQALSGSTALNTEARAFLAWPPKPAVSDVSGNSPARQDNLFAFPTHAPQVLVRLGSIHSVKGETHTATLVLDSFYHEHHLSELKPWLLGEQSGNAYPRSRGKHVPVGPRMEGRLRLHYVAMTRPTHLLCLAMRKNAFHARELDRMVARGWELVDCCAAEFEEGP